ncbi:MAG: S-methyl-5'-thioadenosine phosphorylase [Nitrososphaeraceae archaeon]|jgi:5'-methylthioadenosine phosphorylase|nr:S-methyl-5'-thioadenosine phosphorylase [Nitrososphaeraceae archaeon]
MQNYHVEIGIIGGTGTYNTELLTNAETVKIFTPYGSTSDLITIGEYNGRSVAFIPRHGKGHTLPPHRVNSRANIWALHSLGVSRIIAPSAVGSLQDAYKPGDIVLPDQFIDFTKGRDYTFYDEGKVCHVSCADPFCNELREVFLNVGKQLNTKVHNGSNYICIEGPRFSTRAESKYFREILHGDIIGMTLVPECVLAREMEICYVSIATVTDYDVWYENPVSSKEILGVLTKNANKIKELLAAFIPSIPISRNKCKCGNALHDAMV